MRADARTDARSDDFADLLGADDVSYARADAVADACAIARSDAPAYAWAIARSDASASA